MDRSTADRELERMLRDSRLGASADRAVRSLENAWDQSRTRAVVRWLLMR
jgi:hypothetical protein